MLGESVFSGRIAALAGPSGVGKSSILNRIMGKELAETGEISQKLGRGKNTTRHAELFALEGGGHIFDTPGFTSFDLEALKQGGKRGEDTMEEQDLAHYYPFWATAVMTTAATFPNRTAAFGKPWKTAGSIGAATNPTACRWKN